MQLRDYQIESVNAALSEDGNALIVLPTGSGKSLVIAGIVKQILDHVPDAVIVTLQHRQELVSQNFDKFTKICPEHYLKAGVYAASLGTKDIKQVTFSQIQSIWKKDPGFVSVLIVDECHLIPPEDEGTFKSFIAKLKEHNPQLIVIGLTATPFRMKSGMITDGKEPLFPRVTYIAEMSKLIDQGYLAPLKTKFGMSQADLSEVKIRGGEYVIKDMEDAMSPITEAACDEIISLGSSRKHWLVFCTSISHAESVCRCLNERGIRAGTINGRMSNAERGQTLKKFESGEIQALTNCEIATTGYDFPGIDLIAILRATKSPGLFVQMCGRGLRIAPGKTDCLILDFAGNIERFGCIDNIRVRQRRGIFFLDMKPMKMCPSCGAVLLPAVGRCDCGYVFKREAETHEAEASDKPIMTERIWANVVNSRVKVHNKIGSPPSLKVTYELESGVDVSEWLCFEKVGFASQQAYKTWTKAMVDNSRPLPRSTEEAFHRFGELRPVNRVKIMLKDKFWRVLEREYGERIQVGDPNEGLDENIF